MTLQQQVYGPQTYQIEKLLLKIKSLTPEQIKNLSAGWGVAWAAARGAAWGVAWDATRAAGWGVAWDATRDATRDAACALVVRDLIGEKFTQEHYDLLTKPWRDVIGEFEEPPVVSNLQSQVDALKNGDYVRAVFKYHSDTATYDGYAVVNAERIAISHLKTLSSGGYYYLTNLTSIKVITPPLPIRERLAVSRWWKK